MTTPEPGAFYFGGATDALSADADVNMAQALYGPSPDEQQRVGFPNFTEPAGGSRVWTPPENSLVGFPSREDRADAADIARNLGGTMFAQPGAALDPNGRPVLINEDGSMSTERNIGVSDPRLNKGRHTNIPSIQEGRQLSVRQAIDWALKSGIDYPSYDTPEAADAAAIARHRKLEPAGQGQPGQPEQVTLPPIQNTPDFMSDELTAHLMQMLLGRQGQ
jgi:hypothetical protein